jgi:hypothetical protein
LNSTDFTPNLPAQGKGRSPFDAIRRVDTYGREYWLGRDLQPLMGYPRWQTFVPVINRAKAAAGNCSDRAAVFTEVREKPSLDFQISRAAAYYVAMNGDPTKVEVAAAQAYFVHQTRAAELAGLEADDIQRTALARAREMIDYKTFRDMMSSNAPDYQPSSKLAGIVFGAIQNKLYRHITGYDASGLRGTRELETWPGRESGAPVPSQRAACRNVAKNYMSAAELAKLNRMVGRLCLAAEGIAEDKLHLSLAQWQELVDAELALNSRWSVTAA